MKNSKKRGFTIIELVIVIAVIAILAGVLIPTFVSVINKANESTDTALIKYLNDSLTTGSVGQEQPKTMQQALDIVEADGYNVAKIKATASGASILWDSVNNCFAYLKKDATEPTYIPDSGEKTAKNVDLWKIVTAKNEFSNEYSNYVAYEIGSETIEVTTGLDVGNNADVAKVVYTGTTTARNIVIRTNGATALEVNGYVDSSNNKNGDVVSHYGAAGTVSVIKCAMASFHEFGEVNGDVVVTEGHVVLENTATVGTVKVADGAAANEVKLSNNTTNSIVVVDADNKLSADSVIGETSVKVVDKDAVALIGETSYKTLSEAFAAAKDGDTVKLIADYRIDKTKTAESDRLVINNKITLDFGDYHIIAAGELSSTGVKNFAALFVCADTTFVANGGGIISEHNEVDNDCGPYGANVSDGAKLIVKSGSYFCGGTAFQVQKGALEIYGGKIAVEPYASAKYGYKYLINCIDAAFKDGTATITVYGGSFYKFDPANSKSENPWGDFVAAGYRVNCVDEWYTVVPQ